jgi:hypothetical protein
MSFTAKDIKELLDGNELDLNTKSLEVIPVKALKEVPRATKLDFSNNRIVEIPPEFCSLTHIVRLDLSRNEIGFLPDNFGDLKNLAFLDLFRNEIQELPLSFGNLSKLKWIDMKNNPLDEELAKVAGDFHDHDDCTKAATAIVAFMKKKANRREEDLTTAQKKLATQKKATTEAPRDAQKAAAAKNKKKKKPEDNQKETKVEPKNLPAKKDNQRNIPNEQIRPIVPTENARDNKSWSWMFWAFLLTFTAVTIPVGLTFARITESCTSQAKSPREVKAFCNGISESYRTTSVHKDVTANFQPVFKRYWEQSVNELQTTSNRWASVAAVRAKETFAFLKVALGPVADFLVNFAVYLGQNCYDLFGEYGNSTVNYFKTLDTKALSENAKTTAESAWKLLREFGAWAYKHALRYSDIAVRWFYKGLAVFLDTFADVMEDPQGTYNRIYKSATNYFRT